MVRQKARGKAKHPPPRTQAKVPNNPILQDFARPSFSLRDEALNSRHHNASYWSSDTKLRLKPIMFVKASSPPPEDRQLEAPQPADDITSSSKAFAEMTLENTNNRLNSSENTETIGEGMEPGDAISPIGARLHDPMIPEATENQDAESEMEPMSFVVDTAGDASLAPTITQGNSGTLTSLSTEIMGYSSKHSSIASDSSDEIVFKGRLKKVTIVEDKPIFVSSTPEPQPRKHLSSDNPKNPKNPSTGHNSSLSKISRDATSVEGANVGVDASVQKPKQQDKSKQNLRKSHKEMEDAALQDYLENVREQDPKGQPEERLDMSTLTHRDLSLDDDPWVGSEGGSDTQHRKASPAKNKKNQKTNVEPNDIDGWDPSMLEDFNDASTSEGFDTVVNQIIATRERLSKKQYLVIYEGYTADEARWILKSSLTSEVELQLAQEFDEKMLVNAFISSTSEDSDDIDGSEDDEDEDEDDDGSEDEEDDDDDFKDEEDLLQRKIARMTDERIAQILAKQEYLGLGSDDVHLFGDDDDLDEPINSHKRSSVRPKSTKGGDKYQRARNEFPSASLMADVLDQDPYNGFDIMDFERPSLKKKRKGRRGDLPFELSDEDLQATLRETWETDRKKKATKKQEREELRAQGLLGKKNKFKPDLKAKYSEGMSIPDIRKELKEFLNSDLQERSFPPMDKKSRKGIHEVALAFNLESKSHGSGNNRFPRLIKKKNTLAFDDRIFDRLEKILSRGYFPRLDGRSKKSSKLPGGGGGAGNSAVTYRDGDIVGFGAAEIGIENRGRVMLEKMGWSSGTALGALNNKGILQPVSTVVKTTKAGLG